MLFEIQRNLLRLAIGAGLCLSLVVTEITPLYAAMSAAVFLMVALSELLVACREQDESRVWSAEFVVLLGMGYLAKFGWLVSDHGWAMFLVLLLGFSVYLSSQFVSRFRQTVILSRPLELTGFWLPLLTVVIGVGRHFHDAQPQWVGLNSLALLLVAMVVQGTLAHPNVLWTVGLGVGAAVVALGAFCENHREQLQQRLRMISASLRPRTGTAIFRGTADGGADGGSHPPWDPIDFSRQVSVLLVLGVRHGSPDS